MTGFGDWLGFRGGFGGRSQGPLPGLGLLELGGWCVSGCELGARKDELGEKDNGSGFTVLGFWNMGTMGRRIEQLG